MVDCSLLLVVDDEHLDELSESYPTWFVCHPEIADFPVVMIYDKETVVPGDDRIARLESIRSDFGGAGSFKMVGWPWNKESFENHRVKMLTAYIRGSEYVDTAWFLKIDTDAIGVCRKPFMREAWFQLDNAFIARPTKYSSSWLRRLESWAEGVPDLSRFGPLDVRNRRGKMCSWMMFGNVEWSNMASRLLKGPLPVPSQDTYHSYVARKTRSKWVKVKFDRFGWDHRIIKSRERSPLLDKCPEILRRYGYDHYIAEQR